jgi:8-oxo-dGTP pyrophosphatase MutT (NUDIX family)
LAAEREVEEETGIKAEFQGIITFRFSPLFSVVLVLALC